jgi:hypothetical protein
MCFDTQSPTSCRSYFRLERSLFFLFCKKIVPQKLDFCKVLSMYACYRFNIEKVIMHTWNGFYEFEVLLRHFYGWNVIEVKYALIHVNMCTYARQFVPLCKYQKKLCNRTKLCFYLFYIPILDEYFLLHILVWKIVFYFPPINYCPNGHFKALPRIKNVECWYDNISTHTYADGN